ncbi:Hypothetical protein KVN_LOCUS414 [uncultured virus]|nr:Hypothetical protein KVN_LOCUS414 [uncultured virus]
MYCSVDEAFNNNISKQFKKIEVNNNKNISFETNINNQKYDQSYFDAQGDFKNDNVYEYDNKCEINGTLISDLKKKDNFNEDTLSLPSNISYTEEEPKKNNHDYFIKKFVDNIINDDDSMKSNDTNLYDHLKQCKYCRGNINQNLKKKFKQKGRTLNKDNFKEYFENVVQNKIKGYNIQELIIIICIGFILILVLDFLVRITRRFIKK